MAIDVGQVTRFHGYLTKYLQLDTGFREDTMLDCMFALSASSSLVIAENEGRV
jgi:hypothetical protein